jgi:hypothetical protein
MSVLSSSWSGSVVELEGPCGVVVEERSPGSTVEVAGVEDVSGAAKRVGDHVV